MAKKGGGFGGPGMPGGQAGMMRQLQKMQQDMVEAQEALANEYTEVSVGGGAITIVISGHQRGGRAPMTVNPCVGAVIVADSFFTLTRTSGCAT